MAVYVLDSDEAVILQEANVLTETKESVDLVLTSKNLIQVNKGFLGGDKSAVKYPLSELKLLNGKANVLAGKNKRGSKRIELYFSNCELYYSFNTPFAINKWIAAITKTHRDRMTELKKSQKQEKGSLVDSVKGVFDKRLSVRGEAKKICKCSKCGAELAGIKGEQVTCSYCDNVIVMK